MSLQEQHLQLTAKLTDMREANRQQRQANINALRTLLDTMEFDQDVFDGVAALPATEEHGFTALQETTQLIAVENAERRRQTMYGTLLDQFDAARRPRDGSQWEQYVECVADVNPAVAALLKQTKPVLRDPEVTPNTGGWTLFLHNENEPHRRELLRHVAFLQRIAQAHWSRAITVKVATLYYDDTPGREE